MGKVLLWIFALIGGAIVLVFGGLLISAWWIIEDVEKIGSPDPDLPIVTVDEAHGWRIANIGLSEDSSALNVTFTGTEIAPLPQYDLLAACINAMKEAETRLQRTDFTSVQITIQARSEEGSTTQNRSVVWPYPVQDGKCSRAGATPT